MEEYLNLTDDEVSFLIAYEYGEKINNPWHGSILGKVPRNADIDDDKDDDPEEELIKELDQISDQEKVEDLDTSIDPE